MSTKEKTEEKSNEKTIQLNNNKSLGLKGENAAAHFLEQRGYEIVARNWTCKLGEIDIVALYDNIVVFVEVKTRKNLLTGLPEDAVTAKKRKKYECLAAMFLQDHDYVDMPVRFDVIGILVINSKKALIRHHVNAFGVS